MQSLIESGQPPGHARRLSAGHADRRGCEVPPSVQALLAARIDRLAEREKQVLQTAAVIGKEFAEPILRRVLAASRTATRRRSSPRRSQTLKAPSSSTSRRSFRSPSMPSSIR